MRSGGPPSPWEGEALASAPELPAPSARPGSIVHVGAVPGKRYDGATVARERRDLGRAAGSVATGLKHIQVPEDKLGAPPHCHSAEEEIFVVLEGDGALILRPRSASPRRNRIVSAERHSEPRRHPHLPRRPRERMAAPVCGA